MISGLSSPTFRCTLNSAFILLSNTSPPTLPAMKNKDRKKKERKEMKELKGREHEEKKVATKERKNPPLVEAADVKNFTSETAVVKNFKSGFYSALPEE